jgi:hypothetical protein
MPEQFSSRGIGQEWNLHCFVTGTPPKGDVDLKPNIAAFVESRQAGERVVAMFNGLARLDYRPHEPNWIQVKVGVLPEHIDALRELDRLTREGGDVISPEIIAQAKAASAARPAPER